MVEVSLILNGKKVNPNNMQDALEEAVFQDISESIKKELASVKCSEHNQYPKILINGRDFKSLSFEISGCCDKFIKEVTSKLS